MLNTTDRTVALPASVSSVSQRPRPGISAAPRLTLSDLNRFRGANSVQMGSRPKLAPFDAGTLTIWTALTISAVVCLSGDGAELNHSGHATLPQERPLWVRCHRVGGEAAKLTFLHLLYLAVAPPQIQMAVLPALTFSRPALNSLERKV